MRSCKLPRAWLVESLSALILSALLHATLSWPGWGMATCLAQQTSSPLPSSSPPPTHELQLTTAPGLSVQKVADERLVTWPMLADWDQHGRLVVVESAGVSKPIQQHNEQLLHRIVRLVDDNGDGVFDRRILAADKLPFTEGVLCLGSDLLITAPPYIWKLSDHDQDGYCESREVWFDGQTITGCANDLHGPYLGRDGWIYWCKGAFAKQNHGLPGGGRLTDGAAHIHRRPLFPSQLANQFSTAQDKTDSGGKTDSWIEPLISGGMDNPVEVASLRNGERFFTSTFLVHPGDGKRDGVAHAIYGGAYGKDHSALDGVVRTGALMPIMSHLGAAAPSGLTYLESNHLIQQDHPTLVAALFNLQKVVALPVQPSGATYRSQPFDLLVGDRVDFHPTDVLEYADGSLLVIDTGGWYDLCCPSSRVDQFTAVGGIYRLRPMPRSASTSQLTPSTPTTLPYSSAEVPLPDAPLAWDAISAEQTVALLNDPRPWVARTALLRIAGSGDWAVDALTAVVEDTARPLAVRQAALWALGSTGSSKSLSQIHNVLKSQTWESPESCELGHIACHLVALHRYAPAKDSVEAFLKAAKQDQNWALARVGMEALGKIGDQQSVSLLFDFASLDVDRVLDHSLRYALFELKQAEAAASFLNSQQAQQQALALSTLQLLQADDLLTEQVLIQATDNPATVSIACDLLLQRPQQSTTILQELGGRWKDQFTTNQPSESFRRFAQGWHDQAQWQGFVGDAMLSAEGELGWLWKSIALRSRERKSIPVAWFSWVMQTLRERPSEMAEALSWVDLSGDDQRPIVDALLEAIQAQADESLAQQLLLALPARPTLRHASLADRLSKQLKNQVESGQPAALTWHGLRRLQLAAGDLEALVSSMDELMPTDLISMLEIVSEQGDQQIAFRALEQLSTLRTARTLPQATLQNLFRHRDDVIKTRVREVADLLSRPDPQVQRTVQAVLERLPEGDPIRGLTIYHSAKANCGACHQMGYRGGKIGPELSRIGSSRTVEAMLEAILFPSQRIEQGFDTQQIVTVDGRVLNGIVIQQNGNSISLRTSADRIETVALEEIEQQRPGELSIMPAGMMELLSDQELADLISLLKAAR